MIVRKSSREYRAVAGILGGSKVSEVECLRGSDVKNVLRKGQLYC